MGLEHLVPNECEGCTRVVRWNLMLDYDVFMGTLDQHRRTQQASIALSNPSTEI